MFVGSGHVGRTIELGGVRCVIKHWTRWYPPPLIDSATLLYDGGEPREPATARGAGGGRQGRGGAGPRDVRPAVAPAGAHGREDASGQRGGRTPGARGRGGHRDGAPQSVPVRS